ncbi:hypothetical protein [Nocardia sp. NPDC058480]|uniref:hypothetical protein n=1 Tax=unclassified Nocardia TaxID=2637762 RepID=UPI003649F3C0
MSTSTFPSHDRSRVRRLDDLDTPDGPDLHGWLTDAPVIEGGDGRSAHTAAQARVVVLRNDKRILRSANWPRRARPCARWLVRAG